MMQNEIELVIRIPEVDYKYLKELYESLPKDPIFVDTVVYYIGNGTPLPKGHGRLIDADKLSQYYKVVIDNNGITKIIDYDNLDDAPTIIEADTKSEEV